MDESLDRNILWIIKAHPEFAKIKSHDELIDEIFMKQSFDITAIGKKLVAFNVYFLNNIARPKDTTLEKVMENYDYYYGKPSREIREKFQTDIKKIYQISNWKEFYNAVGLYSPVLSQLANKIYNALVYSTKKGYNKNEIKEESFIGRQVKKMDEAEKQKYMERIFKYTWRQDNDHNDYINQIKQKQQNKLNKQKSNKNSLNWRGESNQHSKYILSNPKQSC